MMNTDESVNEVSLPWRKDKPVGVVRPIYLVVASDEVELLSEEALVKRFVTDGPGWVGGAEVFVIVGNFPIAPQRVEFVVSQVTTPEEIAEWGDARGIEYKAHATIPGSLALAEDQQGKHIVLQFRR